MTRSSRLICHNTRSISRSQLFYIDPPYLHSTRGSKDKRHKSANSAPRWQYKHEIEQDQHIQLARLLHQIQGAAIVSGYYSGLYLNLFPQGEIALKWTSSGIECLWLNLL